MTLAVVRSDGCSPEYLESKLAVKLVEGGYINRNFTLYASTYYAVHVSSQAMNFIIHNIDPDVTDPHFALTPDDVEAIIRERGEAVFHERSMYNLDILDVLLEKADSRLEPLIDRLATFGDEERSFLQAYLSGGQQQPQLIRRLVGRWPESFKFLISEAELDEVVRLQLVNSALEAIAPGIHYDTDDTVRRYLETNYPSLGVFTSDETDSESASRIVRFLSAAKVRPAELKPLGANVRSAAIANSCYAITHANLVVASEGADLALDTIRRRNPTVYGHLLSHMPEYLKALSERDASSQTVRRAREFEEVLEDVLQHDADSLPAVVALASPECEVTKLTKLPCASWTALAKHRRFPATLENVTAYLEEIGTVDPPLAQLLRSAKGIAVPRGSSETQKAEVATRILAARGTLPEPELRTMLVLSLGLEERLPAASLQPEQGKLIGLLVERCIVEDNAETLALVQSADWPTREFAISKSAEFPSFMTTAHVRADDIEPLMKSKLVSDSVKKAVLDRVDEFVPTDSRGALTAIATFADSKQVKLEIGFVSRLASARVESELILRILRPLLPQLAASQIVKVLRAMGDEFLMMAEPNGKRPKLRNTESHLALVERLEELGLVSSHAIRGKEIQVYMKRNQELVGSNNISGE